MSESTPDKILAEIYLQNALKISPELVQRIRCARTREELYEQIESRNYASACSSLELLVEAQGWKVTHSQLMDLCAQSLPLRERTGDVLLHFFGLSTLLGLDIDPVEAFASLSGNDVSSLQVCARETVFPLFKEQVAQGNTYFLDVEQLQDLPFLMVLPNILSRREQEVLSLSETPSHNEILRTYYGFIIMTASWNLEQGTERFVELCRTLGKRIEVRSKRLTIMDYLWKGFSPRMQVLLKNTARLCLTKSSDVQEDAIRILGETVDVRVIRVLEDAIEHIHETSVRRTLHKTLKAVGWSDREKEKELIEPYLTSQTFVRSWGPDPEEESYERQLYEEPDEYDYDDDYEYW